MKTLKYVCSAVLALATTGTVSAVELITNGGFETGDFTGWTITDQPGSAGTFFIDDADGLTPLSGFPTVGPAAGAFYAVNDQSSPTANALVQGFTVPLGATSMLLAFDMFVNDFSGVGPVVDPAGLDYTAGPNQHARVDILTATAGALSTAGADVVANLFLGVDTGAPPNPFTAYAFDLTGLLTAGTSYQLRFGEVNNLFLLNQGVDNVSLQVQVPAPATLMLVALGLTGLAWRRRLA